MKRHYFAAIIVLLILSGAVIGCADATTNSPAVHNRVYPSQGDSASVITSLGIGGYVPVSADTETRELQKAIESFYTLIINTYHRNKIVDDPIGLDPASLQMQNLLTFLRNKTTIFTLMSEYGGSLSYSWHKPGIEILNIRRSGNEADVLIHLRLSNWQEDEVLPELVLPGENRFSLIHREGRWMVREYDTSSDALANEMIPVDRKIDLKTVEELESEYSPVLSISKSEAIDTLKRYYELFFLTYSNLDVPDNVSEILNQDEIQMQNLNCYWKNKLSLFAAAGLGPGRYQVKSVGIKITEFTANKDRATVSIMLDVRGLDPQEVLPEFVNPGPNTFHLRRVNGQVKVSAFDTSTDPLAALDIPADRLIDLWTDDYIRELLRRVD